MKPAELEEKIEEIEKQLFRLVGYEFQPEKHFDRERVLYNRAPGGLGLKVIKRTTFKNRPSCSYKTIKELREQTEEGTLRHTVLSLLLQHTEVSHEMRKALRAARKES
jgi:hypothetical protein